MISFDNIDFMQSWTKNIHQQLASIKLELEKFEKNPSKSEIDTTVLNEHMEKLEQNIIGHAVEIVFDRSVRPTIFEFEFVLLDPEPLPCLASIFKINPVWRVSTIVTPFPVNLLASNGQHVFCTSFDETTFDLIATFSIDDMARSHMSRDWKQSRIVDIVWWEENDAYICATKDAVYTVTLTRDKLKILKKITGNWSYVRVATNETEMWLWVNENDSDFDGIDIYDSRFRRLRTINFDDQCFRRHTNDSTSFCITNNLVASICERGRSKFPALIINFSGMNMISFKSDKVAKVLGDTMIRTDGNGFFYVTTGGNRLCMVRISGVMTSVQLPYEADSLAVVNSECLVLSNNSNNLQMVIKS